MADAKTPAYEAARRILEQALVDAKAQIPDRQREAEKAASLALIRAEQVEEHMAMIASIEAGIARLSDG